MDQLITTMRQRSWLEMIRQRESSGLTIKEWCLSNNVSENAYYYRINKLRKEIGKALPLFFEVSAPVPIQEEQVSAPVPIQAEQISACPMQTSSDHMAIVIHDGPLRIEIGCDVSPAVVETIIRSLHA